MFSWQRWSNTTFLTSHTRTPRLSLVSIMWEILLIDPEQKRTRTVYWKYADDFIKWTKGKHLISHWWTKPSAMGWNGMITGARYNIWWILMWNKAALWVVSQCLPPSWFHAPLPCLWSLLPRPRLISLIIAFNGLPSIQCALHTHNEPVTVRWLLHHALFFWGSSWRVAATGAPLWGACRGPWGGGLSAWGFYLKAVTPSPLYSTQCYKRLIRQRAYYKRTTITTNVLIVSLALVSSQLDEYLNGTQPLHQCSPN